MTDAQLICMLRDLADSTDGERFSVSDLDFVDGLAEEVDEVVHVHGVGSVLDSRNGQLFCMSARQREWAEAIREKTAP